MTRLIAWDGCKAEYSMGQKRPQRCKHGALFAKIQSDTPKPRKPLKQGKGFSASKAQREKVKGLPCASCGVVADDWTAIDPAHVWPRGKGGCDHPDCVIPLCRYLHNGVDAGCHRLFDEGGLELLPSLIDRGYWREMAHPIAEHEVSPNVLVELLTTQPANLGEAA